MQACVFGRAADEARELVELITAAEISQKAASPTPSDALTLNRASTLSRTPKLSRIRLDECLHWGSLALVQVRGTDVVYDNSVTAK
jgi:hypothetical protein